MSEVTTGSVALGVITAVPKTVGNACIKAGQHVNKYCKKQYQEMINDIQLCDDRLQWLDRQLYKSPRDLSGQVKELVGIVSSNSLFQKMTEGVAVRKRELLAGAIATQNSPLNPQFSAAMEGDPEKQSFEKVLKKGIDSLTKTNFEYVAAVLSDLANASGFGVEKKIIKCTAKVRDNVYSDSKGRKLTTFLRLGRDGSPKLAVDLEGFACDTHACTNKMEDIIRYLKSRGISFNPKRIKHNNPLGVLRKYRAEKIESSSYLRNKLDNKQNHLNQ